MQMSLLENIMQMSRSADKYIRGKNCVVQQRGRPAMENKRSADAFAQYPPSKEATIRIIQVYGFVNYAKLKALLQDSEAGIIDCTVNVSGGIPADAQDMDKWERGEEVALLGRGDGEAPRKAEWILRSLQCLSYMIWCKTHELPPGSLVLTNFNEVYPEMDCAYAFYHREVNMEEISTVNEIVHRTSTDLKNCKNADIVHVHVNLSPEKCQKLFKATEEKNKPKMSEEKFNYYRSSMERFLKSTPKIVTVEGEEGLMEYIKSL